MRPHSVGILAILVKVVLFIHDDTDLAKTGLTLGSEDRELRLRNVVHSTAQNVTTELPHDTRKFGMTSFATRGIKSTASVVAALLGFTAILHTHSVGVAVVAPLLALIAVVLVRILVRLGT